MDQPSKTQPGAGNLRSPIPTSTGDNAPPLMPGSLPSSGRAGVRQAFSILLSLCLGLFLADGLVSLLDDSLIVFFGVRLLTGLRAIFFFFTIVTVIIVYGAMGLTPMVPKRWFLPVTLFVPVAILLSLPLFIYFHTRIQEITWAISFTQVIVAFGVIHAVKGRWNFQWPLVHPTQLESRRFSWKNLSVFVLSNLLVLVPGTVVYLALCSAFAVDYFSAGFVGLRRDGLTMQMRNYVDDDGNTVQLFPVAHIGDAKFFQTLSQSFPTNAIILLEGVTDNRQLLTNKISYKKAAASLGLAEQQQEFKPAQGELIWADIDVAEFTPETIKLLNLVMLFHSQGMNPEALLKIMQYSPPPGFEKQLFDDLLRKRNRYLLNEIKARLAGNDHIVIPWGAAHMPEIARELEKSGFHLKETKDFVVIRFGSDPNR